MLPKAKVLIRDVWYEREVEVAVVFAAMYASLREPVVLLVNRADRTEVEK
jgi:hypothetical protein